MIFTRFLGAAALAALMLTALVGTASATTLEVSGVKQTSSVTVKGSLKSGTSMLLSDTFGGFANTCTASTVEGSSTTFTGTTVSGGGAGALTFTSCKEEAVVVDAEGSVTVENIAGTTNGTVRSVGAKVTTPSPYGTLTCVTASSPGSDMGTLTGVTSGNATANISGALNCGAITAKLTGTYTVTSPSGLGITS